MSVLNFIENCKFFFHSNYILIQRFTCINANYFIFNSFRAPTTSFFYVPIICACLYYFCAARTFYVHGCMWWCLKIICSTQDFHIRRISQSKVMLCITTWAFSSTQFGKFRNCQHWQQLSQPIDEGFLPSSFVRKSDKQCSDLSNSSYAND